MKLINKEHYDKRKKKLIVLRKWNNELMWILDREGNHKELEEEIIPLFVMELEKKYFVEDIELKNINNEISNLTLKFDDILRILKNDK